MNSILKESKFNSYDYSIIFLIALLSLGNVGHSFKPVRMVALICIPLVFHRLIFGKSVRKQKWTFVFFGCWFCYMLLSLVWTFDRVEGIKELIYYPIHFSLFFLLVDWSKKAKMPLKSIMLGWIMVLILTLPIAFYEIVTYHHLPMSRHGTGQMLNLGGSVVKQRFASVTFYNRNTYVVIVVFCLPFLYGGLMAVNAMRKRIGLWILLFASSIVLFINASRGGVICLFIISLAFFLYSDKRKMLKTKGILGILIILAIIIGVFSLYSEEILRQFAFRVGAGGKLIKDNSRLTLYGIELKLLKNSLLIGTGVGSMQAAMKSMTKLNEATHNLFLEVLMQYGVLVFVFFSTFLFRVFYRIKKVRFKPVKFILIAFLLVFPPLFVINSVYLLMPSVWLLLSSLFVIGTNYKILAMLET